MTGCEFFACVASALATAPHAKNLAAVLEGGKALYNFGAAVAERVAELFPAGLRQPNLGEQFAQAVVDAQADPAAFAQAMRAVVERVVPAADPALKDDITEYLKLIPPRVQHAFARHDDPTGTTAPANWVASEPEDVLPLLPPRPPRFKADDDVPGDSKWTPVSRLGIGGFGKVWLARHKHLGRQAAFKFCLDPASQAVILRREAAINGLIEALLEDTHIVRLEEADLRIATPWLRHEYVAGGTLAQLAATRPTDKAQRARLATDANRSLAETMARCHGLPSPIVHRDLKPSNVLRHLLPDGR